MTQFDKLALTRRDALKVGLAGVAASGATFPLRAAPGLMGATVISVLIGACVSCLLPVRRIGRLDPADAVVRP